MIPNKLLEAIVRYPCSGGQKDIVLATIRLTYGFHRNEHQLSIAYLAKVTGRHEKKVATDLRSLILKRVLLEIAPASFSKGRVIAVNKNHHQWVSCRSFSLSQYAEGRVSAVDGERVNESTEQVKKELNKEVKESTPAIPSGSFEVNEPIQEIVTAWNEFADKHELSKMSKLTKRRNVGLLARMEDKEFKMTELIQAIEEQPFLLGQNGRGWRVDFDWIFLKTDNYLKIMERKYKNGPTNAHLENQTRTSQAARASFTHSPADIQRLRNFEATLAERDRERGECTESH